MKVTKKGFALSALALSCQLAFAQSSDEKNESNRENDIEKITVIGTQQSRYVVKESSALTGFDLNFLELPRIVNIIPEQLILDQKVTELTDLLRNTPGITLQDGFGGTNDDFLVRGFRRSAVYRNGFRRTTNFKTNLSNVELTQIIRGPASITYGQVDPGGLVDIITKKPLEEQRIAGEARLGSFNDKFAMLDWSQPLGDNAGIRIVGSTQDSESFRDFTDIKRDAIAISGVYDFSPSTRLNLSYEYRNESRPLDRGTVVVPTPDGPAVVNDLLDIPFSVRFGEEFENFETNFNFLDATLEHDLGNNWDLRISTAYEISTTDDVQTGTAFANVVDADGPVTDDGRLIFQSPAEIPGLIGLLRGGVFDDPTDRVFLTRAAAGSLDRDNETFYLNGTVTGEIQTGNLKHRVSISGNYRKSRQARSFFTSIDPSNLAAAIPALYGITIPLFNVSNPIYGNLTADFNETELPRTRDNFEELGFFINDYINITDNLAVLIGARIDSVKANNNDALQPDLPSAELEQETEISPQIAVNYKVAENASVFASYSESFEPNIVTNPVVVELGPFDAQDSNQFELGAKAEFFDGKLQASTSIYAIERTNILVIQDDVPILLDGQTSEGFEISISGQPMQGMNIVTGYAYTDAEIGIGRSAQFQGNIAPNVSKNSFNFWGSYEIQAGELEGLGIGAGYFYTDDRFGDIANSFSLDSFNTVDLSVWYTLATPGFGADDTIRFQLAAKNIFEEEYYSGSGGATRINIGAPRTVIGSVSFAF